MGRGLRDTVPSRARPPGEPRALFVSSRHGGCREEVEISSTPRGRAGSTVSGRFAGPVGGFHPTAAEPPAAATKDFVNRMDKTVTSVPPLGAHRIRDPLLPYISNYYENRTCRLAPALGPGSAHRATLRAWTPTPSPSSEPYWPSGSRSPPSSCVPTARQDADRRAVQAAADADRRAVQAAADADRRAVQARFDTAMDTFRTERCTASPNGNRTWKGGSTNAVPPPTEPPPSRAPIPGGERARGDDRPVREAPPARLTEPLARRKEP